MKSRFLPLKSRATSLRKRGLSLPYIENKLGVPRSTLSGWFKDIKLSKEQREKLFNNWKNGLVYARKKAAQWHIEDGNKRRIKIRKDVEDFFIDIDVNKKIKEIILATFYLAEGTKKESSFVIANSNSGILVCLVKFLRDLYGINEKKIKCCLHLRNDQNENELKKYWSNLLKVPLSQFFKTQFDKRTIKKTYEHYKGVCVIYYNDMALQRRILYIGEKILKI